MDLWAFVFVPSVFLLVDHMSSALLITTQESSQQRSFVCAAWSSNIRRFSANRRLIKIVETRFPKNLVNRACFLPMMGRDTSEIVTVAVLFWDMKLDGCSPENLSELRITFRMVIFRISRPTICIDIPQYLSTCPILCFQLSSFSALHYSLCRPSI